MNSIFGHLRLKYFIFRPVIIFVPIQPFLRAASRKLPKPPPIHVEKLRQEDYVTLMLCLFTYRAIHPCSMLLPDQTFV